MILLVDKFMTFPDCRVCALCTVRIHVHSKPRSLARSMVKLLHLRVYVFCCMAIDQLLGAELKRRYM